MKTVTFKKFDKQKQIVFAEVYSPMVRDTQNDFMTAEDIEGIAYEFMGNGKVRNIDTDHDGIANGSYAVESFVAKDDDKTFVPGSWVLGVKVPDVTLWKAIEGGTYTGFSMEGEARREPTTLDGKPANLLKDVTINSVSIVRKSANKERFKVMKHDQLADAFANIAKAIEAQSRTLGEIATSLKAQDQRLALLAKDERGRIYKAEPINPNADAVARQLRKRAHLQSKLEEVWERPDLPHAETEHEIRRRLVKCEDKLVELGHLGQPATLDSNSAFFERGGSSTFLSASVSTLPDILGVSAASRQITKADEDEISLSSLYL